MKLTKSSVHRLQLEKGCGCKAVKEYEDPRYTKSLGDGNVTLCEKHEAVKSKDTKDVLTEMLLETLELQAEAAGKSTFVSAQRQAVEGDSGGVVATHSEPGGSTQAMGMIMPPKIREKQDPLAAKKVAYNRPPANRPSNTNLTPMGNLNVAGHEDISPEEMEAEGITMDYTTEDVPLDERVARSADSELKQLEEALDDEDMKESGVPLSALRQAVD